MNAASNNHSPKRCNILLHLGRPGAKGGLMSWPSEVIATESNHNYAHMTNIFVMYNHKFIDMILHAVLEADDGPELDIIGIGGVLVTRLVVNPINDAFGIPI